MKKEYQISILVIGSHDSGKTQLIQSYQEEHHDISSIFNSIQLIEYSPSQTLKHLNPHAAIIIFDVSSRSSFQEAISLIHEISYPKLIIGNITQNTNRQISYQEAVHLSQTLSCFYQEISTSQPQSILKSLNFFLTTLQEPEESVSFDLSLKVSSVNMHKIKLLSIFLSILTGISGIAVLMLGAFEAVLLNKDNEQGLCDSLLTSGTLTFIISFIGYYGAKREGIKEYLKGVRTM